MKQMVLSFCQVFITECVVCDQVLPAGLGNMTMTCTSSDLYCEDQYAIIAKFLNAVSKSCASYSSSITYTNHEYKSMACY